MSDEPVGAGPRVITSLLVFWVGYVALTLVVGLATSAAIHSEVWRLITWGFLSSAGLLVLSRFMTAKDEGSRTSLTPKHRPSSPVGLSLGLLLGLAAFGVHAAIVTLFGGPIRFERVPEVGTTIVAIYLARFLATSCMEEIGFRGYALRRLAQSVGIWPALAITTVAFGLSHLLYGWDMQSIALGVLPGGLVWGMSAIATRGLAVPIGMHAAWNFASWAAGNRAETGLLRMIVTDDALESSRAVGTVSYLVISGVLTAFFWLVQRRNARLAAAAPAG